MMIICVRSDVGLSNTGTAASPKHPHSQVVMTSATTPLEVKRQIKRVEQRPEGAFPDRQTCFDEIPKSDHLSALYSLSPVLVRHPIIDFHSTWSHSPSHPSQC